MATVALDVGVLRSDSRFRGIGRYAADLARGLAELGGNDFDVVALDLQSWTGRAEVSHELGRVVEQLAHPDTPMLSHARWAYTQRFGLGRALRHAHVQLVHTPHPEATPLEPLPCPRISTCHDLIPYRFPEHYVGRRDGYRWGRRKLDARRYNSADHIVAVSQASADDLVRLLELPASKITVVHNGADLSRWSPNPLPDDESRRAALGLGQAPYLFYVGAADWRKNTVGMLSALARARRSPGGGELVLAWAGKMGTAWHREIRRAAAALGLGGAVRLLGFLDDADLEALYRGAVAQLFVSRAEGFGYPVIEAMASGCPVIASNCSSTHEIAEGAALSVPPEDHDAIADAALTLLRDEGERRRLRAAGLERARGFSLERMARETREVYAHVLARG